MLLRDYQIEICESVRKAFENHRSVMVQMPTGTGKTAVLASLVIKELKDERINGGYAKVLIVAHRRELIEQIKETIKRIAPPPPGGGIVVESIQTVSRRIGNPPTGGRGGCCRRGYSLVIIDEAHHALAKTYKMMWKAWPDAKFLGLTATPWRMSGDGFTDLFEVLVQSHGIKRFIADGWLCPYDYYSVRPDSDDQKRIDSLTKRGTDGDYQTKEMREKLDDTPCIERLFAAYKRHADGKKGIVYAIDIEHAEHIADYYKQQGIDAVAISSKTPKEEREKIIKRFKSSAPLPPIGGCCHADALTPHRGAGRLLVSVDLFSEGFDCPDVEFIQIARPTLSLAKYLQMVGRGLRAHQGKECCTIIDHVGLYRAFGLPSADRDWETAFCGLKNVRIKELKFLNRDGGWIPSSLLEAKEEDVVKIVSHEGMSSMFEGVVDAGFETTRNVDGNTVWVDKTNGVTFSNVPTVVDFSGMELSTDDGIMFYPRIDSPLIDKDNGIHYNLLKLQVGDGILWKKRYVSLAHPTQVFALQETMANGVRIFKDKEGRTYLQQDPDHPLVAEKETGRNEVMRRSNEEWRRIEMINEERGKRLPTSWKIKYRGQVVVENHPHDRFHRMKFYDDKVRYVADGWVDMKTLVLFKNKPEIMHRGFIELLRQDGLLYIRKNGTLCGFAFPNYAIRADDRICVVGKTLYLKKNSAVYEYKIKKKSEDFTFFIAQHDIYDYMIENKPGQDVKVTYLSMTEECRMLRNEKLTH